MESKVGKLQTISNKIATKIGEVSLVTKSIGCSLHQDFYYDTKKVSWKNYSRQMIEFTAHHANGFHEFLIVFAIHMQSHGTSKETRFRLYDSHTTYPLEDLSIRFETFDQ